MCVLYVYLYLPVMFFEHLVPGGATGCPSHKLVQSGELHPESPRVWRNTAPDNSGDQKTTKDRVLEQARDTADANNTVP